MIKSEVKNMYRLYETENSFAEYQVFKQKYYYLLGVLVWKSLPYDIENRPITEWIRENL